MRKRILGAVGVALGALLLTGCSSYDNGPDQVSLHYGGGVIESNAYKGCASESQRSLMEGPGDVFYTYPAGQRNYTFANGGESGPLTVVTKDNVTMTVPGIATFELNTDCADDVSEILRSFHENIGLKYDAFIDDNAGPNGSDQGWVLMLNDYVGKQLDRAADSAAKKYTWRELYTDASKKAAFEQEIATTVPVFVKQLAGGDYFKNWSILINSLTPPENVVQALNDEQATVAQARAEKAKALAEAETAKAKADAQVAVQEALARASEQEAKAIENLISVLGVDGYIKLKAIQDGRVQILPIPEGSSVIAQPKGS
jgi:regulator of protease activity HflC (stomatin/prohibitin superfamily)